MCGVGSCRGLRGTVSVQDDGPGPGVDPVSRHQRSFPAQKRRPGDLTALRPAPSRRTVTAWRWLWGSGSPVLRPEEVSAGTGVHAATPVRAEPQGEPWGLEEKHRFHLKQRKRAESYIDKRRQSGHSSWLGTDTESRGT